MAIGYVVVLVLVRGTGPCIEVNSVDPSKSEPIWTYRVVSICI